MLSGERNENGKKTTTTTTGLISKKVTLHVQHTFSLYISSPFFLHDCNVKLPSYTFYEGNVGRSLVQFFFSLSLIFTLVAPSIPPLQTFMLFLQQKMSPFVFSLSLYLLFSLSFAGVSPYFLSFSFSIFQICEHDN